MSRALETTVELVEHDVLRHEGILGDHSRRLRKVEVRVEVLAARLGIYAAIGALLGGAGAHVLFQ